MDGSVIYKGDKVQADVDLRYWYTLLIKETTAGMFTAIAAPAISAPIERIASDSPGTVKAAIDSFLRIKQTEGFLSLWKGSQMRMWNRWPSVSIHFTSREHFRNYFLEGLDKQTQFRGYIKANLSAGAAAGATYMLLAYPYHRGKEIFALDVVKDLSDREYKHLSNCIGKNYQAYGLKGLYTYFIISCQGPIIYRTLYFGLYDTVQDYLPGLRSYRSLWASLAIAQATTMVATVVAHPFGVARDIFVKDQVQIKRKRSYRNVFQCWRAMFANEGPRAFYKGLFPSLLSSTTFALFLVVYERFKCFIS